MVLKKMLKNIQISLGRLTYSVSQNGSSLLCPRLPCAPSVGKGYSTTEVSKPLGHKGLEELKKKRTPLSNVQVDFFYDTISPYSWFAFEVLQRYKQQWNLDITYKPIFLAGLTKLVSNNFLQSLTENPNKARYMFTDIERSGNFFKVPLRLPESPFYLLGVVGSLKQQRFLTAVKLNHDKNVLEEVSRGLWYRVWSEDMDCAKPTSLSVVGRRAGLSEDEVKKCLEEMSNDTVKNELIRATEEAKSEGAFGMPYLVVHRSKTESNSFFGSDRFEVIADYIGHSWDGPVPKSLTDFVPLEMAPDPANGDINEQLLKMGATTINKEIT